MFLYENPTILIFSPDVVFQTRLAVVEIPQSGVGIINSVRQELLNLAQHVQLL